MSAEGLPFDIRGIEDPAARETLREVLNRQRIAGIQTRLADDCPAIWNDEIDLPIFDRELQKGGIQMVWAEVCLSPLTWLRLQAATNLVRGFDVTVEEFLWEPLRRGDHLADMMAEIEARSQAIPKPVLELDREGRLRGFQEGRTRGVAAFYADVDAMPALVMLNTTKDDGDDGPLNPPSEFALRAKLENEQPEEIENG